MLVAFLPFQATKYHKEAYSLEEGKWYYSTYLSGHFEGPFHDGYLAGIAAKTELRDIRACPSGSCDE